MALPPKQAARSPPTPLLGKALLKQTTTSPQVRQAVKVLGQAGNTPGIQPGKGSSRLPRGTALPPRQTVLVPGKAILHLTPLIGFPKGLPQKTPTLSGSLTYPENLWHQHKGLFWLKDPKQPPNLEYKTAIEAACTKLSQQDAEEPRAEVNRVLRSSHPPNPT